MSSRDDERSHSQPLRMIYDTRRHVEEVRFQFIDEYRDCRLTTRTKRELASAALKYWSVLHEHRNDTAIDAEDLPDVSPSRERLGKQTRVRVPSKRLGKDKTTTYVPAIDELNPEYVIEVTRELDDLANKLGFGASTADTVPNDRASEDDLKTLLETRGQSDAVENLPSEQEGGT